MAEPQFISPDAGLGSKRKLNETEIAKKGRKQHEDNEGVQAQQKGDKGKRISIWLMDIRREALNTLGTYEYSPELIALMEKTLKEKEELRKGFIEMKSENKQLIIAHDHLIEFLKEEKRELLAMKAERTLEKLGNNTQSSESPVGRDIAKHVTPETTEAGSKSTASQGLEEHFGVPEGSSKSV